MQYATTFWEVKITIKKKLAFKLTLCKSCSHLAWLITDLVVITNI